MADINDKGASSKKLKEAWVTSAEEELRLTGPYAHVAVLMIGWDETLVKEQEMLAESDDLSELFRNKFGHTVEPLVLQSDARSDTQSQLESCVRDFVESHDGPHESHLLIVYYNGHGGAGPSGSGKTLIMTPCEFDTSSSTSSRSCDQSDPPRLHTRWKPVDTMLQNATADVLVILDCCAAGAAMQQETVEELQRGPRSFEVLAACGPEGTTAISGNKSYTRCLIQILKGVAQRATQGESTGIATPTINGLELRRQYWTFAPVLYNLRHGFEPRHIRLLPLEKADDSSGDDRSMREGHRTTVDVRVEVLSQHPLSEEGVQLLAKHVVRGAVVSGLNIAQVDLRKLKSEPLGSPRPQRSQRRVAKEQAAADVKLDRENAKDP